MGQRLRRPPLYKEQSRAYYDEYAVHTKKVPGDYSPGTCFIYFNFVSFCVPTYRSAFIRTK